MRGGQNSIQRTRSSVPGTSLVPRMRISGCAIVRWKIGAVSVATKTDDHSIGRLRRATAARAAFVARSHARVAARATDDEAEVIAAVPPAISRSDAREADSRRLVPAVASGTEIRRSICRIGGVRCSITSPRVVASVAAAAKLDANTTHVPEATAAATSASVAGSSVRRCPEMV